MRILILESVIFLIIKSNLVAATSLTNPIFEISYRIRKLTLVFNDKTLQFLLKISDRSSLFLLLLYNTGLTKVIDASVAKLVDARDLKSLGCKAVPVRLRPEAPQKTRT